MVTQPLRAHPGPGRLVPCAAEESVIPRSLLGVKSVGFADSGSHPGPTASESSTRSQYFRFLISWAGACVSGVVRTREGNRWRAPAEGGAGGRHTHVIAVGTVIALTDLRARSAPLR